jgi:hypothetical protein
VALLCMTASQTALGQAASGAAAESDTVRLLRLALGAAADTSGREVGLDPRRFIIEWGNLIPLRTPSHLEHAAATLAALSAPGRIGIMTVEAANACLDSYPTPDCQLSMAVALAAPVIFGDSATVDLQTVTIFPPGSRLPAAGNTSRLLLTRDSTGRWATARRLFTYFWN